MSRKGEQEGLLKRLKIIESKNDQQLKAVKDQGEQQLDVTKKMINWSMMKQKSIILLQDWVKN